MIGEFEELSDHGVGLTEEGLLFALLLDFAHALAADHFVKDTVVAGEFRIERLVVGFIGDVDRSDEGNLGAVFFVSGDRGLQVGRLFVLPDAEEIGFLLHESRLLSQAEKGEEEENNDNFH